MKFTQPTTTSVVAILFTLFSFSCFGYMLHLYGNDATTRTQIITIIGALLTGMAGYYYGASKSRNTTPDASNGTTTATMTGTITSTPTDGTTDTNTP